MESGPSRPLRDGNSKPANLSRFQANQKKYGTPLPIILPSSPLHPDYKPPASKDASSSGSSKGSGLLSSFWSALETPRIEIPRCVGVYDPVTRSVWVEKREDMEILFNRGFFGKGTLSRSEPTWRDRRVAQVKGGDFVAAEKIREKRRIERKQFKIDRAEAMLTAAKAAEAVLVSGRMPNGEEDVEGSVLGIEEDVRDNELELLDEEEEERPDMDKLRLSSNSPAPSVATTTTTAPMDLSSLTPQTFLVRPTRPDSNRNRGRKAFRRKPPNPPPSQNVTASSLDPIPNGAAGTTVAGTDNFKPEEIEEELIEEDPFDESVIEDMEHLQLSLEEAWFLSAGIGVLRIYDPTTDTYPPFPSILPLLLTPTVSISPGLPHRPSSSVLLLPDDPFLVSYVCYHHYRALGWVVKPGIKFASDWLLYRRGPVFSHAAFSLVMIPEYGNPADRDCSPHAKTDWYQERISWKWMNTIMRVNSLVQKTVILVYITIPSLGSFPAHLRPEGGSLDPLKMDMRALLSQYHVKEVSLTRFSPARRRD